MTFEEAVRLVSAEVSKANKCFTLQMYLGVHVRPTLILVRARDDLNEPAALVLGKVICVTDALTVQLLAVAPASKVRLRERTRQQHE